MASTKQQMHDGESESGMKTPTASYNDMVMKLLLNKNPDKKKDVLKDYLTTAIDLCNSFLLEFELSHVQGVTDKLESLGIWDMKAFANNTDLFRSVEPLWGNTSEPEERVIYQAAQHLQTFLRDVRAKVSEAKLKDNMGSGSQRQSRDASRGRSRERKRRKTDNKKKDKRASSSSSTSSSDRRRQVSSDLVDMIGQTEFKEIPLDHFPNVKMAARVLKKCKVGATLSSEAIERWISQCVGSELPSAGQKRLVAEREKCAQLSLASLL